MRVWLVIPILLAAGLAVTTPAAAADASSVFTWLDQNARLFKTMVNTLGITAKSLPAKTKGTLLVPSDQAISTFLKQMSLTHQELLARKQLVDLVVGYHFIPGYTAKDAAAVPHNPTVAVTADVNYILRFYKEGSRVWVKDVQGNDITITKKPILFGDVSIIPIDKVLMSGGYFFTGKDALRQYPQWSDAYAAAQKVGWPVKDGSADLTMFVPDNAVVTGRNDWVGLSLAAQKDQLLYHFVKPAMSIPGQLKSGRYPTLLKGHDLVVEVTGKKTAEGVPVVTVKPEVGAPATITIFNIFAGKTILQGVDGSLQPKLSTAVTTEAAPKAASNSGKRNLLSGSSSSSGTGRVLLGSYRRGPSYNGMNQATANSIAATNTQYAINAAANGDIPVGAATQYGHSQAQSAALYGDNCYNCYYGYRG